MMKLNILTNLILAAVATAGMSTAAFAANKASFEAQLTVDSVSNCQFTVTPENGTSMTATYKYTAADQAAGDFGTTTLDTTAPLTVLVSSGADTCPLHPFTVATNTPGIKIAKNTAGIPTHSGGVWPVRWVYSAFDAYSDATGTVPVTAAATTAAAQLNPQKMTYSSTTGTANKPAPTNWVVVNSDSQNQLYGNYKGGMVPGLASIATGGHIIPTSTEYQSGYVSGLSTSDIGLINTSGFNDNPLRATPYTITPATGAVSVRIGLAQIIATFPYATSTRAPDPLTVFDTASGSGGPLTGTGTMTITAL